MPMRMCLKSLVHPQRCVAQESRRSETCRFSALCLSYHIPLLRSESLTSLPQREIQVRAIL